MIPRETQATELEGICIMSYLTADKVQTVFSLGCSMAEHAYERDKTPTRWSHSAIQARASGCGFEIRVEDIRRV